MKITQGQYQNQNQTQQQQQRISASQRQTLIAKILSSGMDLREIVARETDDNPALELEEDDPNERGISLDDLREKDDNNPSPNGLDENIDDWDSGDYAKTREKNEEIADDWEPRHYDERISPAEYDLYERKDSSAPSFYSDLLHQLDEMTLQEEEKKIATYIIGNLENTGYLLRTPRELADDLLTTYGKRVSCEKVENVLLTIVQQLEPTGVGARNLAECLALQLKVQLSQSNNPLVAKALYVIENLFEDFSKKQFDVIMRKMGLTKPEFGKVTEIIRRLTPHPGPGESTQYITPDFLVTIEDGKLQLSLANEYTPKLRVNQEYYNQYTFYRKKKQTSTAKELKQQIDKAERFIGVLSEVQQTLRNVMETILDIQEKFFLTGDSKELRPMILKDISDRINMDESTISRSTSRRYVQTPFGIFLLKNLFSEATNKDDGVAATALREHISELIENEDKRHPLTDEKITELLAKQGFQISRRTVAKYRDQLGISSTSIRRIKN